MFKFYPQILSIIDTLNDWNEKLNDFSSTHLDNVLVGTIIVGIIFVIGAWGINTLNKR